MKDQDKTKEQLINELIKLRQRIVELGKSEECYRSLVECVRDVIYTVSLDGTITFLNPAFENIAGWSCTELIGKPLASFVHPDDWPLAVEMFERMMRGVKPPIHEVRVLKKSGEYFRGEFAITPDTEHGKVVGVLGVGRDITERKRAEEAQWESEKRFRTIFEKSGMGITLTDLDGRILNANRTFAQMLGYAGEDLAGKSYLDITHPDEVENERKLFRRLKEGKDESLQFEKRYVRKDGQLVWANLTASIYQDNIGGSRFVIGMVEDITERKRAEDQILRQSAVLNGINKVLREALTCKTEEDLVSKSLTVAKKLTGSKFGWIGEINQESRLDAIALSDPSWNECGMSKSDEVVVLKDMEVRGIWGKVLKEEQSLIVNDPLSHPDSVGIPDGHPPITSFLGVPLKHAGKIFGVIALANKESGYDRPDQEDVENLSVVIVEALKRKRVEEALRECSWTLLWIPFCWSIPMASSLTRTKPLRKAFVQELIQKGELGPLKKVMESGRQEGMQTFDLHLKELTEKGVISEEKALIYADSPSDLRLKLRGFA